MAMLTTHRRCQVIIALASMLLISSCWSGAAAWATGTSEPASATPSGSTIMPDWVPSRVTIETGSLSSGERYIRSTFVWDRDPEFAVDATYENDFFLNNYDESHLDSGTYLSRRETITQLPETTHWASNLPSAYLDTRFGEPSISAGKEIAYTIGSGNAAAIEPGVEYFTLIVIDAGDTDIDNGRLSAQLGVQVPAGCTDTFCSFPTSIVPIFEAWVIPVPGYAVYPPPTSDATPSAPASPTTCPPQACTATPYGRTCIDRQLHFANPDLVDAVVRPFCVPS